jgi:hypothetical protein
MPPGDNCVFSFQEFCRHWRGEEILGISDCLLTVYRYPDGALA